MNRSNGGLQRIGADRQAGDGVDALGIAQGGVNRTQVYRSDLKYLFTGVAGPTGVAQGELKIGGVAVWRDTKASVDGRNGIGPGMSNGSNAFRTSGAAAEHGWFPGCVC